jgi:hypothetical protein
VINLDYKVAREELKEMLKKADSDLLKLATPLKNIRLHGKHEGAALALSYMDELEMMV